MKADVFTRRGGWLFRHAARRRAISLTEVLVVFSIVAFMLALLVPGLSTVRTHARRLICTNNLKQWGMALQFYRHDWDNFLPTEGTVTSIHRPYLWFNVLPPYLNAPSYSEVERIGKRIVEFPELHVWICPAKNLSRLNKSGSGQNQFHYGMNQVLDGMDSSLTPGLKDDRNVPIHAGRFAKEPHTVFLFDIYPNSSNGKQKDVATTFHNDFGNVLYLDGRVAGFAARDFVVDGQFVRPTLIWEHSQLYWGWRPPRETLGE